MSWVFGIIYKSDASKINIPASVEKNYSERFQFNNVDIYAGSQSKNIYYSENKTSGTGWIVCGIGIKNSGSGITFMDNLQWDKTIRDPDLNVKNNDGHFIIITWDETKIRIISDYTGVRDLYINETDDKIIFSTRVDWISEIEDLKVNFSEFGARWLLYNQISDKSIFLNLKRITGGKEAVFYFKRSKMEYTGDFWYPPLQDKTISEEEFANILNNIINVNNGSKIALGLSGGLDSRLLFSMLLNKDKTLWETFTFGDENHPDSIIAKDIAKDFGIERHQLYSPLPDADECINEITEYISQTLLNYPGSLNFLLQYKNYRQSNKVIIDGAFGEICRREYYKRLFWKGKQDIINKDFGSIISHLQISRADIFIKEINDIMFEGCKEQTAELCNKIPDVKEIGFDTWIDIFAVKTRLMNSYSHEQVRLDNLVTAYMPFAQLSLLNNIFAIPVKFKKNGRLFIDVIKKNAPALTKYPRVKSNTTHPFFLTSIQSKIWSTVKSRLKYETYIDNRIHFYLNHIKEYILDIVYSDEVKNNSMYEYTKIKNIAEEYFKGKLQYAEQLDWWFSFEILRKKVSAKL